jgi:hypothetical protein
MRNEMPLFTGDDYQLIAECAYREEERVKLFDDLHGVKLSDDGHRDRLADLAKRIAKYLDLTSQTKPSNT